MTGIQQGLSRCQGCAPRGENVIHQPDLHGWYTGADREGTAEVRQPLLTVQVMLAGADPGALQQIGSDLAQGCGNQARQGVSPPAFPAGDRNEHGWIRHRQGCSQATDQGRQLTIVRTAFQSQQQGAESTVVIREAMPWKRSRSANPSFIELKPVMAWQADRVCLSVRGEGGSAEPAGGLNQQLSAQLQQLVVQRSSKAAGRIPLRRPVWAWHAASPPGCDGRPRCQ